MSNDIFGKKVLFNDGEGLFHGDLNNLQNQIYRQLFDNLLFGMIPNVASDNPTTPTSESTYWASGQDLAQTLSNSYGKDLVFTTSPGGGYFAPDTVTARKINSVPGTIICPIDNPSSPASDFIMVPFQMGYTVGAINFTLAIGDATNPRIDLIEVKLEWESGNPTSVDFQDATTHVVTTTTVNKDRRIKATFQVKQGTPAAIPSYPTPSAGFRAMSAFFIPALFNSTIGTASQTRDLRWPLGRIGVYDVFAQQMLQTSGGTQWVLNNYGMNAPAGANPIWLPCPITDPKARLIGIGLVGNDNANPGSTTIVNAFTPDANSGGATVASGGTSLFTPNQDLLATGATGAYSQINALKMMDQISGVSGHVGHGSGTYVGDRAANTYVGTPIWMNGYASGIARTPSAIEYFGIGIQITPTTNCKLSKARFIVAHGL